jgi:putative phosphoesterase
MRFLCISDIHGHYAALRAVLSAADLLGWDQLVVCGDLCFPGPEPLQVWKELIARKALCVQGTTDKALAQIDPAKLTATTEQERGRIERLRQVRDALGELIVARLARLQDRAHLDVESGHTVLVVHGSPEDPFEPFTHEMDDDELLALVGDAAGDIIICGGSHVPFDRTVSDVRIVNVGSVGEAPSGTHADGTIIETTQLGYEVRQFTAPL